MLILRVVVERMTNYKCARTSEGSSIRYGMHEMIQVLDMILRLQRPDQPPALDL